MWVVPTEKLRDEGIKQEFVKWGSSFSNVKLLCYASLNKVSGIEFDLVVLDECHRITENNSKFFEQNKVKNILGLTATPPKEEEKVALLKKLKLKIIYELPLDKAVEMGVTSPYKIKIIETLLDNTDKYIEAGSKNNRFYTTELKQYEYLSNQIRKLQFSQKGVPKFMYLNRMRFLYNLKSKQLVAKKLLDSLPEDDKILIFHKSVPQIEKLCTYTFHSKVSDRDYNLFLKGKINRLGVVDKVNEGTNIPNLDKAIIIQLNSQPRELVQRKLCAFIW